MELDLALLDRAASDSDDDSLAAGTVDIFMLEKAHDACTQALKNSGIVSPTIESKVLNWLHQLKIVDVFENGDITLARNSLKHGTTVSGDILERATRDNPTTLEVQEDLRIDDWTFVDDFRQASIVAKIAFAENPASYFFLLKNVADILATYEEHNLFHHKQSDQYYKAIEVAVIQNPDQVEEIPTYKKAAFYIQLQKFLSGDHRNDPRNEFEERQRSWFGGVFCCRNIYPNQVPCHMLGTQVVTVHKGCLSKPVNLCAPPTCTTARNINESENFLEEVGSVHLETPTLTTQLKLFLVMNLMSQEVMFLKIIILRLRSRSVMVVMNVWKFYHMLHHKAGFVFQGLHVYSLFSTYTIAFVKLIAFGTLSC